MFDSKLLALLDTVIDNYLDKGDPVWSKFLHSLEDVAYAPSTLRKYLNVLEKSWFVYQPYNSSWRIPTIQWLSMYLEHHMGDELESDDAWELDIAWARGDLKQIVETLGTMVDGVVAGFVRNDEYYFLGINNLLKEEMQTEYSMVREIASFIENKKIIPLLDEKLTKKGKVYYTFFEDGDVVISCLYCKIFVWGYDCILTVVGPTRVNYKKNVTILKRVLQWLGN